MALFKCREEYLETRIMDFDPNQVDESSKRNRHKTRSKAESNKENFKH